MAITIPDRSLIYYGWPSLVNGSNGSVAAAVAHYDQYDRVVFGAGLEQSSHPENSALTQIIAATTAECYGYVRMGQLGGGFTNAQIQARIDLWDTMGCDGIFLDEFGFDYGVHRDDQNTINTYIHGRTNADSSWMNAFDPNHAFDDSVVALNAFGGGNPSGTANVVASGDRYLYESYRLINQLWEGTAFWLAKTAKIRTAQAAISGLKIDCVNTDDHPTGVGGPQPPLPNGTWTVERWQQVYYSALIDSFDSVGWGFPSFSASGNWNTVAPFFATPPTPSGMSGNTWTTSLPHTEQDTDSGAFEPYVIRTDSAGNSVQLGTGPGTRGRYVSINW